MWRRLAHRALRQLQAINFERDFPGAIEESSRVERILELCGRRLKRVIFQVTSSNEKYAVFSSEHHLTKSMVETLAANATYLESIAIDRYELMIITIGAVEAFSQLPTTLEEFSISNCRMSCSTAEVNEIVQNSLRQLLSRSPRLKRFEISVSLYPSTRLILPISRRRRVQGRGWTFDHFVLDENVLALLPDSIRDLSISAGGSLKITNLHFLRGRLLESLALQRSFVSSADLDVLVGMASSLTTLDLTSCINITDGSLLRKLHNLRYLYLGNNRELTDDAVMGVCAGCPRLQRLSLDNCAMLTTNSLLSLGLLFELEWLCLAGVGGVDDQVLERLTNCRELKMLDIKFCRNVTEIGLVIILDLPELSQLDVQGVRAYSHSILQHAKRIPKTIVSEHCSSLPIQLPPLPSAVVR
ncbi:leucine Rich repeat-containing domain protein [Ancylostoma duodenale]|uniref:Leucine Rich repeat-containing domain protein n=1 Tax=Ancylostoma duodenale TaxID=51022 RepID=A0A0C2GR97_9BILA|nr:leucine Rich repeat-containing domain protein [Ancylostoma duodenale]